MNINFWLSISDRLKRRKKNVLSDKSLPHKKDGRLTMDHCRAVAHEFVRHYRLLKDERPDLLIKGDEVVTLVSISNDNDFFFLTESESSYEVRVWSIELNDKGKVRVVSEHESHSDYLPVNKGKRTFAIIENG